jgi:hypothetical protein
LYCINPDYSFLIFRLGFDIEGSISVAGKLST